MKIKSNLALQTLLAASALLFGALPAFAGPQQASPPLITTAPAPAAGSSSTPQSQSNSSTQPPSPLAGSSLSENQAAPFEESFKDGMLTFQAKNQSLRSVLQRIGDETGVSFYLAEGFGNDRISVEFRYYRLVDALRQILGDCDVLFLYGERQGTLGSPALQAVWVYPVSRAEPLPLLASAAETPKQAEPAQAGTGANAGSRVEPPAAPHAADPAAKLLQALQDHSGEVREQALSQALLAKAQIPQDTLINLALTDPSKKVRLLALQALPVDPDLRWVAERAADDLSEDVTYAARGILRMLDLRERAKAWVERTPNPPEQ